MSSQPAQTDSRTIDRIRWRARRGLLENDILLTRFFAVALDTLDATELAQLDKLLQISDNNLLDLLMGRAQSDDAATQAMVERIREA